MVSSFTGGEVFRSLCTWRRGAGRIVYFRPGHETYPTFFDDLRRLESDDLSRKNPADTR